MARDLATNATTQAKVQRIVTRKGAILEVVGIDTSASKAQLNAWINSSQVAITSLRDPDGLYPQSQNVFMTREWWFIVDLSNMKIVSQYFGSHAGGNPSLVALNQALDDMIARLP